MITTENCIELLGTHEASDATMSTALADVLRSYPIAVELLRHRRMWAYADKQRFVLGETGKCGMPCYSQDDLREGIAMEITDYLAEPRVYGQPGLRAAVTNANYQS